MRGRASVFPLPSGHERLNGLEVAALAAVIAGAGQEAVMPGGLDTELEHVTFLP